MLPQVVVLLASGRLVGPFVRKLGLGRAAWISAAAVVLGLAVFGLFSRFGYGWVLVALVLVAAGMRVVGVVAGTNVLQGLPASRTSMGAALVDTSSELATAIGIAITGTILAALFTGSIATANWTAAQSSQFQTAVTVAGLSLTLLAAVLVGIGVARSPRRAPQSEGVTG
jgi:Na+-transporting methylmalonyl-CoA/oxaloacetate decarboxylase gamma subunit